MANSDAVGLREVRLRAGNNYHACSLIFCSQVFSSVRLVENHHRSRLQVFCLQGSSGGHSKAQGEVLEVVYAHGGVLGDILCHPGDMGFDDVISIEVGHLSARLDPNLVGRISRDEIKAGDVQTEFASLGELADLDPRAEDLLLGHVGGQLDQLMVDEEHSALDEAEDGGGVAAHQVLEGVADVLVELGEEHLGLLVGEGPHINNAILIMRMGGPLLSISPDEY